MATTLVTLIELQIDPAGELATLTVDLPPNPDDETMVNIASTQGIDALTLAVTDGATIRVPVTRVLTAGGGIGLRYRVSNTSWYPRPGG